MMTAHWKEEEEVEKNNKIPVEEELFVVDRNDDD